MCLVSRFHITELRSICVYHNLSNLYASCWMARITACFKLYMILFIFTKMLSLESPNCFKFYFVMMSGGKYFIGIFMYSDSFIGDTSKKSFKPQVMNLAPFIASNMVILLISLFTSNNRHRGRSAQTAKPLFHTNIINRSRSARLEKSSPQQK